MSKEQYKKQNGIYLTVEICLAAVCIILFFVSLLIGSFRLTVSETFRGMFGLADKSANLIVQRIRLPRALAAVIAGFGLALSGAVMQFVLDNPMASPTTLGVSNGAVFGANFAIIVCGAGSLTAAQGASLNFSNPYIVVLFALFFSLATVFLIMLLSSLKGFAIETVVLAGLAVGTMFTAGTTVIQYFATDSQQLSYAVFWSFGDLSRATLNQDIIMLCVIAVSFVVLMFFRWDYSAISLGDDVARSLGVRVKTVRIVSLTLASLICAVTVSFLGIIGFIGLIAPHAVKRFVKNKRFILPISALAGAVVLTVSDILCRSILPNEVFPVGAVTSLFGAPLFLVMLLSSKKKRGEI